MSERESFAPLTAVIVKGLNDKLYDKRKGAALEIERMVKEYIALNQEAQIIRLLKVLGADFAGSLNPNTRKGGLIGLAACAIGLGKDSCLHVDKLIQPVLVCFNDQDSRVRYYACEALYNIVKVSRGSVLNYFNDIFDGLSKLAADPDQNVKNGTELLDRLMKDIVADSPSFDLVAFIPLLRDRIYTLNQFAREFIVSWISVLDAVPDINMLVFLPEILDGLFQILGDTNQEIRRITEIVLLDFLKGIESSQSGVDFAAMANILILHSQSKDEVIQFTAITWLKDFIRLAGRAMLPFASGVINAILPCVAYEENNKHNVREVSKAVNHSLRRLISNEDDIPVPALVGTVSESPVKDTPSVDTGQVTQKTEGFAQGHLDIISVVDVLSEMLVHDAMRTRLASLRWLCHLLQQVPNRTFQHVNKIFPLLLERLADVSDEVVLLVLEALAEISSSVAGHYFPPPEAGTGSSENIVLRHTDTSIPDVNEAHKNGDFFNYKQKVNRSEQDLVKAQQPVSPVVSSAPSSPSEVEIKAKEGLNMYFGRFMRQLIELFRQDRQLLDDRGPFIIRQLSLMLNADNIYQSLSERLVAESDLEFACTMVQSLNTILLTASELFHMRTRLKNLATQESSSLFCCLYRSWCHSPIATVSLCYLTQNYSHACRLTRRFGDLEVTVDFLKEIDKLIQLIESPIFAYLRLQLLDLQHNGPLLKSLYGLLMLLPQSEAFKLLRYRLECVPHYNIPSQHENSPTPVDDPESRPLVKEINFDELLEYFLQVQERHREAKLSKPVVLRQLSHF